MANPARRTSVVSSKSGTMSPLPHHRFDHMIGEQKSLVINAQEGLKQSLLILEKATTKEEIESAKLQVESLLPRCEELLTKLMVIVHVRSELDCLQKDLLKMKKSHQNTSNLHARQQWLETRLEKLVFSKRRARPGVRLQRTTHTTQNTQLHNQRVHYQVGVDGRQDRNQVISSHHKRSATVSTISNIIGYSPSDVDDINESSESSMTSSSRPEDQTYAEHDGNTGGVGRDSIYSVWNSESEANWTIGDGHSTISAVAGGKHMLSENGIEPEMSAGNSTTSSSSSQESAGRYTGEGGGITASDKTSDSTGIAVLSDHFEGPRPTKLFGSASWNLLCMPKYGDFMEDYKGTAQGPPEIVLKNAVINEELSTLWIDLIKLQELVQFAGKTMKVEGQVFPSLPPISSARRITTSSSNNRGMIRISKHSPSSHTTTLLPSENSKSKLKVLHVLPDIILTNKSQDKSPRSREVFPKSSLSILHSTNSRVQSSRNKVQVDTEQETDWSNLSMSMPPSRLKLSSRLKSARLKNLTCLVNEHLVDYKQGNIKDLMKVLQTSECSERRHDAAQALGYLNDSSYEKEIIAVLRNAVANDNNPSVKHQAIKGLIKYGAWDTQLYLIVTELLSRGCTEMQCDILTVMEENKSTYKNSPSNVEDNVAKLTLFSMLEELVMNNMEDPLDSTGSDEVLANAAILLSECYHTGNTDIEQALKNMLLHTQTSYHIKGKILDCLVNTHKSTEDEVVQCAYKLAEQPIEWKIRLCGIQSLATLYKNRTFTDLERETVVKFAKGRLVSEPIHVVRKSIGLLLTLLGEKDKTESDLIKKLESTNEMQRAEATIALSAFAAGNKKVQNALMDVVDYDPSQFLKLLVLSLIDKARPINPHSLSRLKAKCAGNGPLAKQCRNLVMRLIDS